MQAVSDDIDVKYIILTILRYKWFLVGFIVLSLIGAYFYTQYQPKQYSVKISFFLVNEQDSGPSLGGYSRLLAISQASNMETYVSEFLKSSSLESRVLKRLNKKYGDIKLIRDLKFSKDLQVSNYNNGFFGISILSTNPQLCVDILNAWFSELTQMVEKLGITSSRHAIKMLDEPTVPWVPSKPNLKQNLMLAFFGSFFIGLFLVYIIEYLKDLFSETDGK